MTLGHRRYPDRLIGDEIPKLARILHVADAFEAMTAARPYRMTPLTPEQALTELRKFAGIQFDPMVVDAFVRTSWVEGIIETTTKPPELRAIPTIGQVAERMTDRMTKPTTVAKPRTARGRSRPEGARPGSGFSGATRDDFPRQVELPDWSDVTR